MLSKGLGRGDDGVTLVELLVTIVVLTLIMTMLFQWLASSHTAAVASVQRGEKESELLLVHELISRDVRSARHLTESVSSSAVNYLSATRVELYVDRDLDGVPNLVIWELSGSSLTRQEFLAKSGTYPNWLFEASPFRSDLLVSDVTSTSVFAAWSETQGDVASCDASVASTLCQLGRLDVSVEATATKSLEGLVELVSSYTFRIEGI